MKPSLPQGTRDFGAETVRKRNYIFNTIKNVFELYGFQPLETPAMENLETLMGKYGEEGDKLIFKILKNEDLIKGIDRRDLFEASIESFAEYAQSDPDFLRTMKLLPASLEGDSKKEFGIKLLKEFRKYLKDTYLTKRALRYDLTIPFARYVAMNHGQLTFPFKRYQMQPVWRADKPQRGRYREFYQCDADIVGSNALLNEVELANIYAEVFKQLGIEIEIRINNRKILAALAEICGGVDKMVDITVAIDKLDKIGLENVKLELLQRGLKEEQIEIINRYLLISNFSGDNKIILTELKNLLCSSELGMRGLEEVKYVLDHFEINQTNFLLRNKFTLDPTLARGLNYYTGTIFEIKALNVQIGSIGGGGRYDDLTGLFDVPNLPGVGISFGVDRIYDVMEELRIFPNLALKKTSILFLNYGEESINACLKLSKDLRDKNIDCEIFHKNDKIEKQFKYASKKEIRYIIKVESEQLIRNTCKIKDFNKNFEIEIPWEVITYYPFNLDDQEETKKNSKDLLFNFIQIAEKQNDLKYSQQNYTRGRSENINNQLENILADYLSQFNKDNKFKILVDFEIHIENFPSIIPDIIILDQQNTIVSIIEIKYKNQGKSELLNTEKKLLKDLEKIGNEKVFIKYPIINSNKRENIFLKIEPKLKYQLIYFSGIKQKLNTDTNKIETYILTEKFDPLSDKFNNLSNLKINTNELDRLIGNIFN